MKKRMASFVLILLFAVNFSGFALADQEEGQLPEGQRISGLVIDQAGLLTEDEVEELSDRAATITEKYQCSVCILTVQSIGDSTRREYAKAFYQQNQMGYGEEQSGILFMVSMENREYVTITYGYGITAFTDYGIEQLEHALCQTCPMDNISAVSPFIWTNASRIWRRLPRGRLLMWEMTVKFPLLALGDRC